MPGQALRPQGLALEVGQSVQLCGGKYSVAMSSLWPWRGQARNPWLVRPVQLGGLICLFSTEVDSAKFPNGATHWASVRMEVCACPEMVYGTLRQSEGGSTACSRRRQMSFQSRSQLAHLASGACSHTCGTVQSRLQRVKVTERHRASRTSHGLVVWSSVTSLPGRRKQRPDQQMQLEREDLWVLCPVGSLSLLSRQGREQEQG